MSEWQKLIIMYLIFFIGSSVEHITNILMLLSLLWALNCFLLTNAYLTKHYLDVELIRRIEKCKVNMSLSEYHSQVGNCLIKYGS